MGNQNSTLVALSSDAAVNGLYAFVPVTSDPSATTLTFTANPNSRTFFSFSNGTGPGIVAANLARTPSYGKVNNASQHQVVLFDHSFSQQGSYEYFKCYGLTDGSKQLACSPTVQGVNLARLYVCKSSSEVGALLIGTNVPSGCSGLNLTYTPSK